jgi:solute carrier family 8 (sodium/calcium exchanger)
MCHHAQIAAKLRLRAAVLDRLKLLPSLRHRTWATQFQEAILPGRAVGEDGQETELTSVDTLLHYISITWKLICAAVPPAELLGGVPCFITSLLMIAALLTYVVVPVAKLFGCVVGLSDAMTAIVFVALGTSVRTLAPATPGINCAWTGSALHWSAALQ